MSTAKSFEVRDIKFSAVDRAVTLAIYDTLRFISRIARRYADRLSRTVDIDALRGVTDLSDADDFSTSVDYLVS
jgi:hypothetical protein